MSHITSKFLNAGGLHGEFSVADMVVFPNEGKLKHVSRFWEAVVAQSLILDRAHAASLQGLERAVEITEDPQLGFEASWRAGILKLSDQYLVRANIFFLLLSFFEFAMLEVYKLRFGGYPSATRPQMSRDVIEPLKADGIIQDVPPVFEQIMSERRDVVRNALAHGRWSELKAATEGLELHEAFDGVSSYLWYVDEKLREKGFKP